MVKAEMIQKTDIETSLSLKDYITLDAKGQVRHEFYNGKLFAMPGETLLHNEICIRVLILLRSVLISKGWKIYMESVKVKIENEDIFLYPDIVVMKEEVLTDLPYKEYIIYNPTLITEILSDSTRKYDHTDKFIQYQKISTLRYYLLVEPEKQVVIFYEKDDTGEWTAKTFTELAEIISLPVLDSQIALGDIYQAQKPKEA